MKKRITAVFLAVTFMALIPLFIVKNSAFSDIDKAFSSKKEIKTNLTEAILYEYRETYSEEGLKALAVILNSNIAAKKKVKTAERKSFIKKHGETAYKKVEEIAEKTKREYILCRKKPLALPYSYVSKGLDKYGSNACNPWDMLEKDYKKSDKGISLNSVNKLCENGLTAEEAVLRFLNEDIHIIKQ